MSVEQKHSEMIIFSLASVSQDQRYEMLPVDCLICRTMGNLVYYHSFAGSGSLDLALSSHP